MIQIAMVEDDLELAYVLTQYLARYDISVTNFEDPFTALAHLKLHKYDLATLQSHKIKFGYKHRTKNIFIRQTKTFYL